MSAVPAYGPVPEQACVKCRHIAVEALQAWIKAGGAIGYCARHWTELMAFIAQAQDQRFDNWLASQS